MTGTVDEQALTQLAAEVGALLKRRGELVLTAESCTGGGIAEALTRVAGSSAWFDRAWVTYCNKAKTAGWGVPSAVLRLEGAVSEAVVRAMAKGAAAKVDGPAWAVAVSGIAGPDGGSAAKPVGTVWVAWSGPNGTAAYCFLFAGDREAVRRQTVRAALRGLKNLLEGAGAPF
jgi:nicotinamide-nucleotide amidase